MGAVTPDAGHASRRALTGDGAMRMEQRQEQRIGVRLAIEAARWGWSRNIEPVEGLSLAFALGWLAKLSMGGVFGTASSYATMARLSAPFVARGWHAETPWAVALGAIVAHLLAAYALEAWGYLAAGYWDPDDWRVHWSRRIRFGGLLLLSGWWMFIAIMFGIANFAGVGWTIYVPASLWTSWSTIRLVWDYGAAVLPLVRGRR